MAKLRVQSFAVSIDGFGAGPNQDLQNPLGMRGPELMEWFFPTNVWRTMTNVRYMGLGILMRDRPGRKSRCLQHQLHALDVGELQRTAKDQCRIWK